MTKLVKFFPTTEEAQDIVIWVDDIEAGIQNDGYRETIDNIMDRVFAGDLKCPGYVHVIDDNKDLAIKMAYALDAQYQKEMELMENANVAKKEVNEVIENTKEEKEMEKKTTGGRRRMKKGSTIQEQVKEAKKSAKAVKETQTKEEEVANVEKKEVRKGRRTAGRKVIGETNAPKKVATGRKRLGRSESIKQEFVKFEGDWYLNTGIYENLKADMEEVIETLACERLGISEIALVDPENLPRYANKLDIIVVVQIKVSGNVLEFPIRYASNNSKSTLSSTSIGWVEYGGKITPQFGFSRPNALEVTLSCTCGNEFKANTGYVRCPKCKTLHDNVDVELNHNLDFADDVRDWTFQTVPNMFVPKDTLALVMALAHYDEGLDMMGVVEEE